MFAGAVGGLSLVHGEPMVHREEKTAMQARGRRAGSRARELVCLA